MCKKFQVKSINTNWSPLRLKYTKNHFSKVFINKNMVFITGTQKHSFVQYFFFKLTEHLVYAMFINFPRFEQI